MTRQRESLQEQRDRLMQVALGLTRPFGISDVGNGPDYHEAGRLLRSLHAAGHLRKVNFVDERKPYLIKYEWVND